ncbi:alpha-L-fucosidase [Gracilibacillus alcaliphilus]|uniref:alpha-L-fucosidase n=1 Tax=Gracilibacillus alcaliphilus TaxID=1401441 RepID=UPI00195AEC83|nr:alpha-L-fucosidase [Gracilibacillus alcaliphilus]MBM7677694.1 alpha-L-fucosidase [Gracilibacillus alcaliphilus]
MDLTKTNKLKGIGGEIELNTGEALASWQRLQFGMFIHWGLYSAFGGERNGQPVKIGYSEQIQMWDRIPETEYLEAAKQFAAEAFDPKAICQLAKDTGMNYIVITSKHHDGFAMFDTDTTDYNIVKQTPYGKDPLKLLAEECHKQGLKFGVYFSLVDWHQGHAFDDNNNNQIPVSMEPLIEQQLRELMTNYGPIAEVWFDMSSPTLEQSIKFSSIVHELQPGAAVNSRIWNNKGDFRTLADNQVPLNTLDAPWQTPASIYHETWGYRKWQERNDFSGKVRDLVIGLTSVRARGGNYLLNIGPRGDGSVVSFEQDVLMKIGEWLNRHPEAILGASATKFGGQSWGEVTLNGDDLYLHVINKPKDGMVRLPGLATDVIQVVEDGSTNPLKWSLENNQLVVKCPDQPIDDIQTVIKVKLAEELRIIPEKTVEAGKDGGWSIDLADIYTGYGFADRGNYNTLRETTIRKTAYIVTEEAGRVVVDVQGSVLNDEVKYQIELGSEVKMVTGKQLVENEIGSFSVNANEVVSLTITLADSNYNEEPLELDLTGINLKYI